MSFTMTPTFNGQTAAPGQSGPIGRPGSIMNVTTGGQAQPSSIVRGLQGMNGGGQSEGVGFFGLNGMFGRPGANTPGLVTAATPEIDPGATPSTTPPPAAAPAQGQQQNPLGLLAGLFGLGGGQGGGALSGHAPEGGGQAAPAASGGGGLLGGLMGGGGGGGVPTLGGVQAPAPTPATPSPQIAAPTPVHPQWNGGNLNQGDFSPFSQGGMNPNIFGQGYLGTNLGFGGQRQ